MKSARNKSSLTRLLSRRAFLKAAAALSIALLPVSRIRAGGGGKRRDHRTVVVVGAGAFGGWTALYLRNLGAEVTLVDAWGPGNSRASSGGETRVIRGMYGADRPYVRLVTRAFDLWQEWSERWNRQLYTETGVLWMFAGNDSYARESLPLMIEHGLTASELPLATAVRRYPQVNFDGVTSVYFEERGGHLLAREACQAVVEEFVHQRGDYRQLTATPGAMQGGVMKNLRLSDGSTLHADIFVFACGPWLGELFPEVIGPIIMPSRQEVFFFGPPDGDTRYSSPDLPIWVDFGEHIFYGIPGGERRGFKIADDTRGAEFDPTIDDRIISDEGLSSARKFMVRRFPGMKDAPLVESRVCQYENSPDGHYIVDRHPDAKNVWIVGGGSGHGFKMGPALGEYVAGLVDSDRSADQLFLLDRFRESTPHRTQLESS